MNNIGLDNKQTATLATHLNNLLANYQVFYMNTRGFHWNIKGRSFFELHVKFEELYNDLQLKIDEIAERVLTLGYTPSHTFSQYLNTAQIPEMNNISEGDMAVAHLLDAFKILLTQQREILVHSDAANDEGTNSLMSDYIKEQEKLVWMYSAYLD